MFCWMSVNMSKTFVLFALAVALIQPQPTGAKCISLEIALEGKIVSVTSDLSIRLEVVSGQKADPVTDVRQETRIENSRFRAIAWFNTTSNVISEETCDRLPHLVIVKLMKGSRELDRQTLKIESDFWRTKEDNYKLKKPITLRVTIEK
jgi:hypothetical protein